MAYGPGRYDIKGFHLQKGQTLPYESYSRE